MARVCRMSSVKLAAILLVLCASWPTQVENKAVYGIGTRIIHDQLLLKDVLQARSAALSESPSISFNYDIPEAITFIEILSQENVLAVVSFSYVNNLVSGTVSAINFTDIPLQPFEVEITIYGFNETMLNVNPALIINRNQRFDGELEIYEDSEEAWREFDYSNLTHDDKEVHDDDNHEHFDDDGDGEEDDNGETDDVADGDFEQTDKIIELGQRQPGDYLIYETFQTSSVVTEQPTNHSVVFYYIDINFITYAKFMVFDNINAPTTADYIPPVVECSHLSANTLKAVVTDYQTTSLFTQMLLYGYKPTELPVDLPVASYVWYLPKNANHNHAARETTVSPMQLLKMAMRAGQWDDVTTEANQIANEVEVGMEVPTGAVISNACSGAFSIFANFSLWTPWGAANHGKTLWTIVLSLLRFVTHRQM